MLKYASARSLPLAHLEDDEHAPMMSGCRENCVASVHDEGGHNRNGNDADERVRGGDLD